jgi:hypothetical protein
VNYTARVAKSPDVPAIDVVDVFEVISEVRFRRLLAGSFILVIAPIVYAGHRFFFDDFLAGFFDAAATATARFAHVTSVGASSTTSIGSE